MTAVSDPPRSRHAAAAPPAPRELLRAATTPRKLRRLLVGLVVLCLIWGAVTAWVVAAQDPWTRIVGPRFTNEPYGLAISKQHPDFVRFVNAVLEQLRSNGQWAASYAHWVALPCRLPRQPGTRAEP